MVFEESIRHPDVHEIGSEWLCYQVLEQLQLADYLSSIGFTEEEKQEQECGIQDMPEKNNSQWKEIIRIMNTQKAVTTVSQNRYDQVIISHRCSEPTPKAQAIYRRLKYKPKPNTNRKFVVHKSEFQKMDNIDIYLFPT